MGKDKVMRRLEEEEDEEEYEFSDNVHLLSTGSTMLNLAFSNKVEGGIPVGGYWNPIGNSSSGKTFLAFSAMAEASIDPFFDNHLLVFDDAEQANLFKIKKLFGQKLYDRLRPPAYLDNGEPDNSETIEDFRDNIIRLINNQEPFIYILDSFDSLSSRAEMRRTDEAVDSGGEEKGSYKMEKAKLAGEVLRQVIKRMKNTESILIIISQTRDNIGGVTADTRSGGRALKFYAVHESWSKHTGYLKKSVNGKQRNIGIESNVKVSKNKLTGATWNDIKIPIYFSYGIDDTKSMINFLLEEKHWSKSGRSIEAIEFELKCTEEKLINEIESSDENVTKLKKVVQEVWDSVLDGMCLKRKPKYS